MIEKLPAAFCPACMMQRAFEPSASEAEEASAGSAITQTLDLNASASSPDVPVPSNAPGPSNVPGPSNPADSSGSADLVEGQEFGDYAIVRRLGRGGMGTVYEADHRPTGRRVALKVLAHSLDNPQARARFLREGRLAASINHPNSVYVYGTEEIAQTPTISMELIRGGTLQQLVKARGPMQVRAAVDAVLQIIDGLEAADRKGVLHRDIKPANCFVDHSGTIKIGDFGLSISTEARDDLTISNVTREGAFLGTPAFASPEQLRGEPLDRRSDIYAVGVTLYYLLTGKTPFSGENMVQLLATVLDKQAPSLRSIREDAPDELDLIVQRCLQKSPGQRFASYDALREALLPLSSLSPTPASMGNRLIANIIDVFSLSLVVMTLTYTWQYLWYGQLLLVPRAGADRAWYNVAMTVVTVSIPLLYYALCEWRFGKTLGKHLLRLRVIGGDQPPTIRQALIRASIFVIVPNTPSFVFSMMVREMSFERLQQSPVSWIAMGVGLLYYALKVGLFVTARSRNGYAGVHELASGTRVVCKPSVRLRPQRTEAVESFETTKNEEKIGPYHVLQHLWGSEWDRLVLAYDAKLLRRVWLRVRSPGSPEIDSTARNLARMSRLRWLGGRRTATESWDCYEALSGKPLTQAIDDGLSWDAMVGALWQLSNELTTACNDSSLPAELALDHLWITDEEILKVLPFAGNGDDESVSGESVSGESVSGSRYRVGTKPMRRGHLDCSPRRRDIPMTQPRWRQVATRPRVSPLARMKCLPTLVTQTLSKKRVRVSACLPLILR